MTTQNADHVYRAVSHRGYRGVSQCRNNNAEINNVGSNVIKITLKLMVMFLLISAVQVFSRQEINFLAIGDMASMIDSTRMSDDRLHISAAGSGIRETSDNFVFAYANTFGDFEFHASVSSYNLTNNTEAGLMVREQTTPTSPFIAIVNRANGCFMLYRSAEGGLVNAVPMNSAPIPFLKIQRVGNGFSLHYKHQENAPFTAWQGVYTINISSSAYIGFMVAPSVNNNVSATFGGISGLPHSKIESAVCETKVIDFNNVDSLTFANDLSSVSLDAVSYWKLDSNYVYSTTPGGTVSSDLSLTEFIAARSDTPPLSFSWKMYVDSDTMPQLYDYVLFGAEGLTIGHRVQAAGRPIGSGGSAEIGNDSKISSIKAAGNITLWDRANVQGNVTTSGNVTFMNQVTVSGTVQTFTPVNLPAIAVKTVNSGTVNRHIFWGDSADLAPGSYGEVSVHQNAALRLRPGVYNFSRLVFEPGSRVYLGAGADSMLELNVKNELRIGDRTGFVLSDSEGWRNIHIYTDQTNQVFVGNDLTFYGYLYAPRAQIMLNSRELAIFGGIYGKQVITQPDSRFAIDTSPAESNNLKVVFGDAAPDGKNYTLQYSINRDLFADSINDFSFYYDTALVFANRAGTITPAGKWLTVTAEFHKTSAAGGDGTVRLLFDTGHGNTLITELNHDSVNLFSNLSFHYTTGMGPFNRKIRLNDITISCAGGTGPQCESAVVLEQLQKRMTVYEGAPVNFRFGLENPKTYEYKWYRNSVEYGGGGPVLFIPAVTAADSGAYFYCRAFSECDTVTSDTTLLVVRRCLDSLHIYKSPTSVSAYAGDTVKFHVHAEGEEFGLKYVWYENDKPIPNSDSKILRVNSVRTNQNMNEYKVRVTNACGSSALSGIAILSVGETPFCRIMTHPQSDTLEEGETFTLEAGINCDSASVIVWLENGTVIPGETQLKLIRENITMSDNGKVFRIVVSNGSRSDTSSAAVLHVVKRKPGSRILAVSGMLYDGNSNPAQAADSVRFKVKLFTSKIGGREVYSERFYGQRSVTVDSGRFTVELGRGFTAGDLHDVFMSHANLYAEIYAGDPTGQMENLGPRLQLTAAPYSMQTGVNVIYGSGNPTTAAVIGTLYVDAGGSGSTWIRRQGGWKKLD